MLKRLLRAIYIAVGLEHTRLGAFIYRVYKGFPPAHARPSDAVIASEYPDINGILVAFRLTGGLGDHLMAARYIRDLMAAVGEFRFDIYSSRPEFAALLFATVPQLNRVYNAYLLWDINQFFRLYPLAMHVTSMVVLQYETIKWRRLYEWPKLLAVCEQADRFRRVNELDEIVRKHPNLDGVLGYKAAFMNCKRHTLAQIMSGIPYGGDELSLVTDRFARLRNALNDRRYLTIHNGFDAEFSTPDGFANRSTKIYPHFDEVIRLIRERDPDLFIVQLGTRTSRPIRGVDLNLIGKTSMAEVADILRGATLHIDNESGLVHLAASVGTPSCVLFGPTLVTFFGYDQNINIGPNTCGGCWWTKPNWMTHCPRGFDNPICLADIQPVTVASAILERWQKQRSVPRAPKKPLAFLLGITENLGFAAGNVALSLYQYMRDEPYEVVIYYKSLKKADMSALEKISNVRLVQFSFPESFEKTMQTRLPSESRFKDANQLMCFCHFEVFSLLEEYENVVWLDSDIAVQANLKKIVKFAPFGITLDTPWPVQNNFNKPIEGYNMDIPGFCTAVMLVNDSLPYKRLRDWCYEKAIELVDQLLDPDQAIINLAFQEFSITPNAMPLEEWQCISWKDEANCASIVHFGAEKKVWSDTNVCNSFPEWYRTHLRWLELGGTDFDRNRIHPRNPLPALDHFDRLRKEEKGTQALQEHGRVIDG